MSRAVGNVAVVVPLFNEEASVAELIARLDASLTKHPGSRIVIVDDGSSDRTVETLARAAAKGVGPAVHVRRLSRNFGLQKAIAAGLAAAMEIRPPVESIAVIDGDLQDRPEHLVTLLSALEDSDVAYAVRSKRRESAAFRAAARIFYATMSRWSRVPIPADAGNYCVMRPVAAAAVLANMDENLFFPGLRAWVGFRQRGVPLERDARTDGNSRMGLRRLLRLAVGAFFGYSTLPLQAMLLLAATTLVGSVALAIALAVLRIVGEVQVQGIALIAILVLGGLGVTLVFLVVLAYMVSRSPAPQQSRALFVVAEDLVLRRGTE
jgi:glycosyltransferase involved in cell wall biosynthesis